MNQWETRRGRPALADLHEIDAACDRFERAWRSGQRPDIAEFLADVPVNARAQLFRDLLSLDLEYRRRLGEQPEARSYCERFPEFATPSASALAPLSSRPTNRLDADNNGSRNPTVGSPAIPGTPGIDQLGFSLHEPQDFGAAGFEILGELGRGGMGVVLKARQAALNRTVALKIVKSGAFASEAELMRFQSEAEAVAQLDHPNIVPIYEVGKCRGQHFFSMKLVNGTSLDRRARRIRQ